MMVIKFRSSEGKDILKKLKKMHKFTKELMECIEEKYEDDDEFEDDEDYREDMEIEPMSSRSRAYRKRYRRSM